MSQNPGDPASSLSLERLYRLAVEQAADYAIFLVSPAGQLETWTPAVETVLGWTAEEFVGQPFQVLFTYEDIAAGVPQRVLALAREHGVAHNDRWHARKGGQRFWAGGRTTALYDGGQFVGFAVVLRDWTATRRTEELERSLVELNKDLRLRVAEFETLLDVLPVGIGIALNAAADNIRVNRAFARMLRMRPTDNASLSAPTGERPQHFRMMSGGREVAAEDLPLQVAAREGREIHDCELEVEFSDGGRVRLLEYAAPLFDEQGSPRGSVGGFIDITQRWAAEERFRLLADAAPVLVWMSDPTGGCTWFNRLWLEFVAQPLESLVGDGWTASVHPDDLPGCTTTYRAAVTAREPFRMQYRLRRNDGAYRWVMDTGRPLFEGQSGAFSGFIGTCIDITEQKEALEDRERLLQAERQARAQAERANLAKDEFLASLSHELRTPLNAILGWTQLLRRPGRTGAAEITEEALETIERNARLQAQLIDDLLDMSRILSGKVSVSQRRVDPARVVAAAIETVRPTAVAAGVQLETEPPAGTGLVSGDPTRLQQVVLNLLTNAVKFTARGGTVRVTLQRGGGRADIRVSDSGIGIAPEFLPHVFDRFSQADGSASRRFGGLGIGLAIVKQLVELHGGSVRAESDGAHRGATFVVSLPLLPEGARPTEAVRGGSGPRKQTARRALAGLRALVVEDDDDARKLVALVLADGGANVTTAASADEALAVLDTLVPDVIVSDVAMPGRDGFAFIAAVRASRGGARAVPAIALTAFARPEDRQAALAAGFQDHVSKPVDRWELCDRVARLVGRG